MAIIRDGHARPPDNDGSLEAGDELLFVTAQDFEQELAEMLAPRDGSINVSRTPTPRVTGHLIRRHLGSSDGLEPRQTQVADGRHTVQPAQTA